MLRLISGAAILDVDSRTSFRFELRSPIFELNRIPSAFNFSFTLPKTRNNLKFFGSPDVIEGIKNLNTEYDLTLEVDGMVLFAGKIRLKDPFKFLFEFKTETVKFIEDVADSSIKSFTYEGSREIYSLPSTNISGLDAAIEDIGDSSQDDYDFSLGMVYAPWNQDFQSNYISQAYLWFYINYRISSADRGTEGYKYNFGSNHQLSSASYLFIPFPYMTYVAEKILEENGIELDSNIFLDDEMRKLVIFSNNPLYFNYVVISGSPQVDGKLDFTIGEQLPDVTVRDFFQHIRTQFNVIFSLNVFGSGPKTWKARFFHEIYADPTFIDITSKVKAVRSLTQTQFSFIFSHGENTNQIDEYEISEDQIGRYSEEDPVDGKGSLPATTAGIEQVVLVKNENRYYFSGTTGFSNWEEWLDNTHEVTQNQEGSEWAVQNKGAMVRMRIVDEFVTNTGNFVLVSGQVPDRNLLMPLMDVPLSSVRYQGEEVSCPLKLMIHHGHQDDLDLEVYPYLGVTRFDINESQIGSDEMALRLNKEDGTIDKYWEDFASMMENEILLDVDLDLNISDLFLFDFANKYRIDRINYFIKNLSITINKDGISSVNAKCVKI